MLKVPCLLIHHFTGKYPTFDTIPCPSAPVAQSMNDFISFDGFTRVYR